MGVRLPASAKIEAAREVAQRLVAFEVAVRARTAGMNDALGYALVVEMGDLLAQDEIFEQRRPAKPGLQRVLVVGYRNALIGREHSPRGIYPVAIKRPGEWIETDLRVSFACLGGGVDLRQGASADHRVTRVFRLSDGGILSRPAEFRGLRLVVREGGCQLLGSRNLGGGAIGAALEADFCGRAADRRFCRRLRRLPGRIGSALRRFVSHFFCGAGSSSRLMFGHGERVDRLPDAKCCQPAPRCFRSRLLQLASDPLRGATNCEVLVALPQAIGRFRWVEAAAIARRSGRRSRRSRRISGARAARRAGFHPLPRFRLR